MDRAVDLNNDYGCFCSTRKMAELPVLALGILWFLRGREKKQAMKWLKLTGLLSLPLCTNLLFIYKKKENLVAGCVADC